jgi:NADH:ubiquinone oxidoreductase subunit 3 (subunit A)
MSLGAVGLIFGTVCIIYAAFSSHWITWTVQRNQMKKSSEFMKRIGPSFETNPIYFVRNYGLYHICFPDTVPSGIGSFSFWGESCIINSDYWPNEAAYKEYTTQQTQRYYLMWIMVICYGIAIVLLFLTMIVGIFACCKEKSRRMGLTTVLLFLAILFLACVALLWHFIIYYEHNAIKISGYPFTWDTSLKQSSRYSYGIAYMVFMASCVVLIFAGLSFGVSWYYVKKDKDDELEKHAAYLHYVNTPEKAVMPYGTYGSPYGGTVGPYYQNYYSQYPTMNNSSYYGYLTYGH